MGFILWLIALILRFILIPIGMIYGFFKCFYKKQIGTGIKNVNKKFLTLAVAIDIQGNTICAEILNDTLITRDSQHLFGGEDYSYTISEVIAANLRAGTLTGFGKVIAKVLIFFKDTAF